MDDLRSHPVIQRLLRYVVIDTASRRPKPEEKDTFPSPSTEGQLVLLRVLRDEMLELGVAEEAIKQLDDGSLIVFFPPTPGCESALRLCLAAHVDTYPGVPGVAVPMFHSYEGGDIDLPNGGITIPAKSLEGLNGTTILTSDGTSLLGGDNKGGVATLMTIIPDLLTGNVPHGPLFVWFCVDEEIGKVGIKHVPEAIARGFDLFLVVDGGMLGVINVGCFVGQELTLVFHGADAHLGEFPDMLKPAHVAAIQFLAEMMPNFGLPVDGIKDPMARFFYPAEIRGDATRTYVDIVPRSFDRTEAEFMVDTAVRVAESWAQRHGCTIEVVARNLVYVNNFTVIDARRDLLAPLIEAHVQAGITVVERQVRGGTDGAMINVTYPNLPTPCMGWGSGNIHGDKEYVVVNQLVQVPGIVLDAIRRYSALTPALDAVEPSA